MGDVVGLRTADKPVQPIDTEVVAMLEMLLERARNGEFQGIAIATVETDGAGSVVGVGNAYEGQGIKQNVHAAIGGVVALQARMTQDLLAWP